jgi:signal transduction histidine kinase
VQEEVLQILTHGFEVNAELDLTPNPYMYRIFSNGEMVKWSDNKLLPAYSLLRQQDSIYYLEHVSGKYIVQKKTLQSEGQLTELFSILQLEQDFQILNNYLRTIVSEDVFIGVPKEISASTEFPISFTGKELFGIIPSGRTSSVLLSVGIWLTLFSLLFTAFQILLLINEKAKQYRVSLSILLILFLRLVLLEFDFPGKWLEGPLFDQVFYNSSFLNFTLGDVLINYLFIIAILIMLTVEKGLFSEKKGQINRLLRLVVSTFFVYGNIWLFHWAISDIMTNSQIEFDITKSIRFDFIRIMTFVAVMLASVSYFFINHLLAKWTASLHTRGWFYLLIHLGIVTCFIQLFPDLFPLFLFQFAWYWIVFLADMSLQFKLVQRVSLEYILSIGAMLSLIFAYTVYQYHTETEFDAKRKFANRLVLEKDVLGEYYLNEIMTQFRNDPTMSDRLDGGIFARQNIREKIRRQFVSSYFDKYELEIILFGPDSLQFDNEGETFDYYLKHNARDEFKTDYPGIYLVNDSENISLRQYSCFLNLKEKGFITINLNRKRNIPTSVFPELLVESKYEQESMNSFDYTIFRDSTVLYGQGEFGHTNYLNKQDIRNPQLFQNGIVKGGRQYWGMKTQDKRLIVIVSPAYPYRNWVVNFSFLFLFFILLISLIGVFYRIGLGYRTLTLANKIQLYLAMGFLIPLFITGIALLNTLNSSYREEITRSYLKKSLRISENLVEETIKYVNNQSDLNTYSNYVGDVSGYVEADLNVYNSSGRLITTSQPNIFGSGLLSERVNPQALEVLTGDAQNIIVDESIGLLNYKATYTTITGHSDGRLYAILALPFFDSLNHLELQQREVFADLLMIFALIFLVALISGNYILNFLIGPLTLVSEHIKRTTLDDDNLPIDYQSQDEIGTLVKEYNQMLIKLERNKEALARSQKESAWKEIARQVAHEIKNPLTPMRLKIQQLQRDMDDPRKAGVLASLITQIDTLSHIADSFSEFAKMPAPINSHFDVREVLKQSVQLHRGKDVSIVAQLVDKPVIVWADPNIMGRIFNNLILNAIQAVGDKKAVISVSTSIEDKKITIQIKDNGQGIAADIQDKIFTTYFSTKSTGSGIGLAVAKKGIENAGGHIWFESVEGEGTTFFLSLPVYEDA